MIPTKLLTVCLALGAVALPSSARAQQGYEDYMYRFEPDDLVGETLATTPPLLSVRPHPPRIMLLRPRASFVAEMLESVEAL